MLDLLCLFPTIILIAVMYISYTKMRKKLENDIEWEKNKDKYKYKDWRY
jgi:hypothetical protein